MKKKVKILALSVLGLVIVAGVLVWMEFGALIKGVNSCLKLDDGLYYMEYKGDDGFKELMARGGCNDISVRRDERRPADGNYRISNPVAGEGCHRRRHALDDGDGSDASLSHLLFASSFRQAIPL